MERETILTEIRRTAEDGRALGRQRFERETGIKESDWSGKCWARWSDAVAEAGLSPSEMQKPYPTPYIVGELVAMIEDLGKWLTDPERRLYKRRNPDSPSHNTYYRLGNRADQAQAVLDYAKTNPVADNVLEICRQQLTATESLPTDKEGQETRGYVYLLKSGRYYKIGRSNDPARRAYEVRLQMPETVHEIHRIATDDPNGIEAYWHRRFADRRAEGEWFKLTATDVRDFRHRATM